ncbi:MASE3 domain-containing sensor histidine kinase [Alkaliphilus serpentinus]|uniref:histidine kinase n=1 Tax=Alkaliphilus serpentinus TaxID=1482731 RepID=A0A833HNB6_9FIRM|nr:ATP-binding protein [Alkaliphilus serpentinus]KAB3529240.1 PAS domain S-box protein [Alkaliphilus serpentinus]
MGDKIHNEKDFTPIIEMIVIFLLSSVLFFINTKNGMMFFSIIEFFGVFISFMILFIVLNTYIINLEDYILFLGISYGITGIIRLIYLLTYVGIVENNQILNIYPIRALESLLVALGFLLTLLILNKNIKLRIAIMIYFVTSFLCIGQIIIPSSIEGINYDTIRLILYVFSLIITAINLAVYLNCKKMFHKNTFVYILSFLLSRLVSEMLFIVSVRMNACYILAHILELVSYYMIYKGIVETSLRRPYRLLFFRLNEMVDELRKEIEIRRRSEKNLKKSQERYRKLVELLPDPVYVHDEDKFYYCNEKGAELLGIAKPEGIIGKKLAEFIPPKSYESAIEDIMRILSNKTNHIPTKKYKIVNIAGTEVDVEVTSVSFPDDNHPLVLSVLRDIRDKKQREVLEEQIKVEKELLKEAIEYDRIKTEFFANLSHELKTPINLIYSTLQLMEMDLINSQNNEKMRKRMGVLRQNCNRIIKQVDNLIDITKLDANYYELKFVKGDIVEVVEGITESVGNLIQSRNIQLTFETSIERRVMVFDPNALERIMLNLLSNAVKFTNCGDRIYVSMMEVENRISIIVGDTGIGIPEDRLMTIFERFNQIDKSLTRNHEGSGLGLTIAKSLVELHGGSLKVKSTYGKGTEFIVELPTDGTVKDEETQMEMFSRNIDKIKIEFSDIYSVKMK